MKNTFYSSILFILLFVGCNQTKHSKVLTSFSDSLPTKSRQSVFYPRMRMPYTEKEMEIITRERERGERLDSIRLSIALHDALRYADKHKNQDSFIHSFEILPDDSSFNVPVEMLYGHLFAPDKKHLMIRNGITGVMGNVYIFLLNNGKFKKVCKSQLFESVTYVGDTLKDINGDSYKDLLVQSYSPAGCCRRDAYETYLYKPNTGSFTTEYHFINPTFYPKEKIIRGVGYGHPGEVGLYKYKWNGSRVDTIEFIYPYTNHEGKFIRTKKGDYLPTEKDGVVLNSLPKEYEDIESLDWFLLN